MPALPNRLPQTLAWAAEQGVPCFADPVAMLEATKPEGAIIATPNALHLAHVQVCAERGVALLVEKPLADTLGGGTAADRSRPSAPAQSYWSGTIAATTRSSRKRARSWQAASWGN